MTAPPPPNQITLGPPDPLGEVKLDLYDNSGNRLNVDYSTETKTVSRERTEFVRDPENTSRYIERHRTRNQSVTVSTITYTPTSSLTFYLAVTTAGSDIGGYRITYSRD